MGWSAASVDRVTGPSASAPGADLPPESAGVRVVFTQLQVALHVLVAVLLAFTVVSAYRDGGGLRPVTMTAAAGFAAVYVAGTVWERRHGSTRAARVWWLAAVSVLWSVLVTAVPEAAYLAFPLFFVAQFVLGVRAGAAAVAALAAVAILALGAHEGFTPAGIVGPVVGALVALGLGTGVRALHRESRSRREVIAELVRTRSELARRQREVGRESERARLAGEIHDTVAQGLASIGMLLHAVERRDPAHPAVDQIRLARAVAGENLAETRRLIAALRPAPLDGVTLAGALERVAERARAENPDVTVTVATSLPAEPPAEVAAVLVRVAQEALANAVTHGSPTRVGMTLDGAATDVTLEVVDDGRGFDASVPPPAASFGLDGMTRRVADLGGDLVTDSEPGRGTTIRAVLPVLAEGAGG